jgi:hypothetical protein
MSDEEPSIESTVLQVLHDLFPVEMDGCLSISNEPDTLLHEGTDVEVVSEAAVDLYT